MTLRFNFLFNIKYCGKHKLIEKRVRMFATYTYQGYIYWWTLICSHHLIAGALSRLRVEFCVNHNLNVKM